MLATPQRGHRKRPGAHDRMRSVRNHAAEDPSHDRGSCHQEGSRDRQDGSRDRDGVFWEWLNDQGEQETCRSADDPPSARTQQWASCWRPREWRWDCGTPFVTYSRSIRLSRSLYSYRLREVLPCYWVGIASKAPVAASRPTIRELRAGPARTQHRASASTLDARPFPHSLRSIRRGIFAGYFGV
jgi:hypothetical protein